MNTGAGQDTGDVTSAASRASDQDDAYWVVTVSRANGSTLTFGPWDADRAHATKDVAEGADVAAFVVGKR